MPRRNGEVTSPVRVAAAFKISRLERKIVLQGAAIAGLEFSGFVRAAALAEARRLMRDAEGTETPSTSVPTFAIDLRRPPQPEGQEP